MSRSLDLMYLYILIILAKIIGRRDNETLYLAHQKNLLFKLHLSAFSFRTGKP